VKYRITILPLAKRQLLEQAIWWAENRSAEQALRWLEGFEASLESLAEHPERFAAAREKDAFNVVIRELHYGVRGKATHRALFEIRNDEVIVYSIRHLAQRDVHPDDLHLA
jgi:plasmid stabilization system protein ParE